MRKAPLDALSAICEAAYLAEHEKIRAVLEEEARLRGALARLDRQAAETRGAQDRTQGYRMLGADLLWQGWEARTRMTINSDLARARARRLVALDGVRHAFGRKEAVADLQRAERAKTAAARDKARAERLLQEMALGRRR